MMFREIPRDFPRAGRQQIQGQDRICLGVCDVTNYVQMAEILCRAFRFEPITSIAAEDFDEPGSHKWEWLLSLGLVHISENRQNIAMVRFGMNSVTVLKNGSSRNLRLSAMAPGNFGKQRTAHRKYPKKRNPHERIAADILFSMPLLESAGRCRFGQD
jgi:hypothetical protein